MKARLTVMGHDRGEIEVGTNSLCGLLLSGLTIEALGRMGEMEKELKEIAGEENVKVTLAQEKERER